MTLIVGAFVKPHGSLLGSSYFGFIIDFFQGGLLPTRSSLIIGLNLGFWAGDEGNDGSL